MDKATEKRIRKEAHEFAEKFTARLCDALDEPQQAAPVADARPAPDAAAQLRAAGATDVIIHPDAGHDLPMSEARVFTRGGIPSVTLRLYGLTLPLAVAALEVATNGKPRGWCEDCRVQNELAAANAEVERLKGEIAAIEGHLQKGHFYAVDRWLYHREG
jgi:hypothetical protein